MPAVEFHRTHNSTVKSPLPKAKSALSGVEMPSPVPSTAIDVVSPVGACAFVQAAFPAVVSACADVDWSVNVVVPLAPLLFAASRTTFAQFASPEAVVVRLTLA